MDIYSAPMEGITGYIYRRCHHRLFGGVDKYFTPFITPSRKGLPRKVEQDILPDNNEGMVLVPQILTNDATAFLDLCRVLEAYGYREFNLNLGCPSGTVTAKGKGAGFLTQLEELDRFLEEIYKSDYTISLKTRLGRKEPEEFYRLLEIYNKYPISELIIHPRTASELYRGVPHGDMYAYAIENTEHTLCYNGNIFTKGDYDALMNEVGMPTALMLGRGMVVNPALPRYIKGGEYATGGELREFYRALYEEYRAILSGPVPLMHKLKEVLSYMQLLFRDSDKIGRKIRKAKSLGELQGACEELFTCELKAVEEDIYIG